MAFCKNCGQKIEEGDRFCTNCGAHQFVEYPNEASDNQEESRENVNKSIKISSNDSEKFSRDFSSKIDSNDLKCVIKMITKPVQGAKEFIKNSSTNSVIVLTLLIAFVKGLLGVWTVSNLFSNIQKLAIGFVKNMSAFINFIEPNSFHQPTIEEIMEITNQFNKVKTLMSISYGKIFFENIMLLAIIVLILFIILVLSVNTLSKNKEDCLKLYKIALVSVVPAMYFKILAIIASYITFYISIPLMLAGIVISLVCFTILIRDELNLNENQCAFIVAICSVVIGICSLMCMKKIMAANVADIFKSLWSNIKNFG